MQRTFAPLLAAAALAAVASAPANGASRFVIHGAGFGHGVGMSQYGAYGYAKAGRDYRFILGHYYTGTALSPLSSSPTVRVLLQSGHRASFRGATAGAGRTLSPGKTYGIAPAGLGRVALKSPAGRTLATVDPPLRVTGGSAPVVLTGGAANGVTSGSYRGALEFRPTAFGGVLAINAVGLEDYVRGVVGAESPASWPADALKAQAVAARTYAITTGAGPTQGFEQYADTRSQMYRGIAAETPATDAAVAGTRGQVVTYGGKPVTTFFFSTSGGRTEDIENSFIGSAPKPWLVSVDDPYDSTSPKHRWGPITMSVSGAGTKLHGLVKGTFRGIDVVERGRSPRVVYADVLGSRGKTRVTGPQLRSRFGTFDTWMTFSLITASGKTQPAPADDQPAATPADPSGGASAGGGGTGGSATGGATPRAWKASAWRGELSGRVMPVRPGRHVAVQRRSGRSWRTVAHARVGSGGRYRAARLRPGTYRVLWRGDAGPVVKLAR